MNNYSSLDVVWESLVREIGGPDAIERVMERTTGGYKYRGTFAAIRREAWYRMREEWRECGLPWQPSFHEIARVSGTRTHNSVLAGVKAMRRMRRER